eukprot:CAMPEP_0206538860 /NCGR_PEP_ID=MMETSP0325_2-20121206/8116_1 /ASSEMBLY_ACC=CAM_ASM_000347 /TAXON_ID=2866 /ORGANISM="Crypthecodinium cohnii, Strain Seligo" /LENGTH=110 /DNA_ID=CAMNT_0054036383 /DNA_START=130 /DNA_END=462 /DNA_ORIENTATION=-
MQKRGFQLLQGAKLLVTSSEGRWERAARCEEVACEGEVLLWLDSRGQPAAQVASCVPKNILPAFNEPQILSFGCHRLFQGNASCLPPNGVQQGPKEGVQGPEIDDFAVVE